MVNRHLLISLDWQSCLLKLFPAPVHTVKGDGTANHAIAGEDLVVVSER